MLGIYCIINISNNKRYVGQSLNIEKRWKKHIANLNSNIHVNKHLQSAWNKLGRDYFKFEILEEVKNEDELNAKEIHWIEYYKTTDNVYGYNKTFGGNVFKRTEETKKKISNSTKGEKHFRYGKTLPDEHKRNLSIASIGNTSHKGCTHSNDTKKKMSLAKKGKQPNNIKKFTDIEIQDILQRLSNKEPMESIGKIYNCSSKPIQRIKNNIVINSK